MFHNKDILINNIIEKGNKVLIWGAVDRNNYILDLFRKNGIDVVGYIDRAAERSPVGISFNGLPVFTKSAILDNDCFVFIGMLGTHYDVIAFLEDNGYHEFSDYWYPCREIVLDGSHNYPEDMYGNEYVGENYDIKIKLNNGGKLFIGQGCKFGDVTFEASYVSKIRLGDRIAFEKATIVSRYGSDLDIGNDVTSEADLAVRAHQNSRILIGNDCMMSWEIAISAGVCHNLFDISTGRNLNKDGRSVIIGEHVWIGHRAMLYNGCEIGSGSIVGMNAFVNKKFPENCSIAGNPARIIKNAVAWRRESFPFFDSYNDFEKFDFRSDQ